MINATNSMVKISKKHDVEQKLGTKVYIVHDSIHMKCENRQKLICDDKN